MCLKKLFLMKTLAHQRWKNKNETIHRREDEQLRNIIISHQSQSHNDLDSHHLQPKMKE